LTAASRILNAAPLDHRVAQGDAPSLILPEDHR